jgi:hypothetical protein
MEFEGRNKDNVLAPINVTQNGLRVLQGAGKFSDSVLKNQVFSGCTAITGISPGTTLNAVPPITLWNPQQSNKWLSILRITMGYVSGTLGSGCIMAGWSPFANPSGGAEILVVSNQLGGLPKGMGRLFTGTTNSSICMPLRPVWSVGAFLATTAQMPQILTDMCEGEFILMPGSIFTLQGVATAGTSPLVIFGIEWEELNNPN